MAWFSLSLENHSRENGWITIILTLKTSYIYIYFFLSGGIVFIYILICFIVFFCILLNEAFVARFEFETFVRDIFVHRCLGYFGNGFWFAHQVDGNHFYVEILIVLYFHCVCVSVCSAFSNIFQQLWFWFLLVLNLETMRHTKKHKLDGVDHCATWTNWLIFLFYLTFREIFSVWKKKTKQHLRSVCIIWFFVFLPWNERFNNAK